MAEKSKKTTIGLYLQELNSPEGIANTAATCYLTTSTVLELERSVRPDTRVRRLKELCNHHTGHGPLKPIRLKDDDDFPYYPAFSVPELLMGWAQKTALWHFRTPIDWELPKGTTSFIVDYRTRKAAESTKEVMYVVTEDILDTFPDLQDILSLTHLMSYRATPTADGDERHIHRVVLYDRRAKVMKALKSGIKLGDIQNMALVRGDGAVDWTEASADRERESVYFKNIPAPELTVTTKVKKIKKIPKLQKDKNVKDSLEKHGKEAGVSDATAAPPADQATIGPSKETSGHSGETLERGKKVQSLTKKIAGEKRVREGKVLPAHAKETKIGRSIGPSGGDAPAGPLGPGKKQTSPIEGNTAKKAKEEKKYAQTKIGPSNKTSGGGVSYKTLEPDKEKKSLKESKGEKRGGEDKARTAPPAQQATKPGSSSMPSGGGASGKTVDLEPTPLKVSKAAKREREDKAPEAPPGKKPKTEQPNEASCVVPDTNRAKSDKNSKSARPALPSHMRAWVEEQSKLRYARGPIDPID